MNKQSSNLDVVVVGNAGLDTQIYLPSREVLGETEGRFTDVVDCVGQAGMYAARGYVAMGRKTGFIGHVGDDVAGRSVREVFDRDGVDTSGMFVDPSGTARSVNFMFPDGTRRNFYDGKGHMTIEPNMPAAQSLLGRARLAHFNIPNWARLLLGAAREQGVVVACDLQDVVSVDDEYRRDFIEAADILFFSAVNFSDPQDLVAAFVRGKADRVVVCGMGAKGCMVGSGQGVRHWPAVCSAKPVVDANGAGDSLAVGFLVSYVLEGRSLEESVQRGQLTARHVCTLRGTSDGLLDPAGLADALRGWNP